MISKSQIRVILDVNHPAHVHFIKNLYFKLKNNNVNVLVVASRKPLCYELLDNFKIPHIKIGAYGKSLFKKAIQLIILDIKMLFICLRFRPTHLIGIVSIRGSHISKLLRFKSYIFTDTEHATEQITLFKPFATKIYTPNNFPINLGLKQVRYNGYHELAYLHPKYFKPDPSVLIDLNLKPSEKFVIIRFVAWNATHDKGTIGFSNRNKIKTAKVFSNYAKVFITSEVPLSKELEKFTINISPDKIHHAIYYCSLVFGESATMSSEAAVLGVPAIFIDNAGRCYTKELEEKYGIVFNFKQNESDQIAAIEKGIEILQNQSSNYTETRNQILIDKISTTDFIYTELMKEFFVDEV